MPAQPLPDHRKQEYDTATFKGGSYTRLHPHYYGDTAIKEFRAPDFGDYDVLEAVIPEAKKRGMNTICWFEDVWSSSVPNIAQAQEKRFDGSNATTVCFNNPNYRNWLLGTVEDYTREALNGTKTQLWPGIDIDIPTGQNQSKSTPEGTRDAVAAALRGGADGVLLSRKYSEMKPANLRGAGAAIQAAGLA